LLEAVLGSMRMRSGKKVKKTVEDWFNGLAADF
jgi:hypothetical protein